MFLVVADIVTQHVPPTVAQHVSAARLSSTVHCAFALQTARCMSGPSTRVIVCQEVRSSAVSAQLRDMLERNFKQVRRISPTSLPVALRQDYVELFECRCE